MKVYVATKAKPFCEETYVGIAKDRKQAENLLKKRFPYMRKSKCGENYTSDKDNTYLLFIHEEDI